MEARNYTVVIEPTENGEFWAYVPALPGCFTQGKTLEEVVRLAQEAVEGFVEMLTRLGKPIPVEKAHPRRSTFSIAVKSPARA